MARRGIGTETLQRLDSPRLPQRLGAQPIRLFIADKFVLPHVVLYRPSQMQRDVRGVASNVRIARGVGVALGLTASFHAIEEVADVERRGVTANFRDRAPRQ